MLKANSKIVLFTIVVLTGVISCKKKDTTPVSTPTAPVITLISITPTTVTQFKDSILITISYKDINGDLGDVSPDENSLNVKDGRLSNPDTYHVKPLAPISDKDISIAGQLTIKLNSLFLIGSGTTESTTLNIKLKDRHGNWSNEITTPQITINQ